MLIPPKGAGFYPFINLDLDDGLGLDEYPFNIPAFRHLKNLPLHPCVTFLVGENGSGKSTLVEAVAVKLGFNAEGGSKNFNFSTHDSHSPLHQALSIPWCKRPADGFFLRAESFYNVATEIEKVAANDNRGDRGKMFLEKNYGGKSLHELSHGESFFALMENRLTGDGFYIFDEPEAALSPQRQFAMLGIIHRLVKDHSQLLIATHSPLLLTYPFATIYELSEDGIEKVTLEETQNYRFTRDVLADPKRFVDRLLREDDDLPWMQ